MSNSNKWIYQSKYLEEVPNKAVGFVYIIINKTNNKKYICKKGFYTSKIIQKNKIKKKVKVESDWRDYYGSNDELKDLVTELGEDNFIREILHLCYSKAQCSYLEAKEQFDRDVILTSEYYNGWLCCKITRKHMAKFKID